MHFIRILCIAALGTPALSDAQAGPIPAWPIAPGSRVRVLSPVFGDQKQAGHVVSTTSDTLVFLPAKQSTSIAIGTPYIFAIDVANGTHTKKLTDALVGLLIGAGGDMRLACGELACVLDSYPVGWWAYLPRWPTLVGAV